MNYLVNILISAIVSLVVSVVASYYLVNRTIDNAKAGAVNELCGHKYSDILKKCRDLP